MLIEIHMIQNHSPSNLNRDDLGAPKTCLFGGVIRARMSSQCLKSSIRNPGNPDDKHKREQGMFAKAMEGHIGCRTTFFPFLVGKVLDEPDMLQRLKKNGAQDSEVATMKKAIVAACTTIARSEGKAVSEKKDKKQRDKRPATPQLIYLGPSQARDFVDALLTLRDDPNTTECYQYFLDPGTVFESLLEPELAQSALTEEQREKALKAGWRIRNTEIRLKKLREALSASDSGANSTDDESAQSPSVLAVPSDEEIAKEIVRGLETLAETDNNEFAMVVSARKDKKEPKFQAKRDRPPRYDEHFIEPLKRTTFKVSVDIALFGRMTTSDAFEDVAAAMQVAHAISTHSVVNEVDYWTAVDDLGKTQASANLGEAIFNSACFYKYFCLDWDQLVRNLAGPEPDKAKDAKIHANWTAQVKPEAENLAARTLGHFIRAAALTTPSGKQNCFAANNEACGILVEIKESKIPTNYANAFADPVERIGKPDDDASDEKSIQGRSVACLADHVQAICRAYGVETKRFWYSPMLSRFPLKYWERAEDGKKISPKLVPAQRFEVLGGVDGKPEGLVEAVVKAIGFDWSAIKDPTKASAKEA